MFPLKVSEVNAQTEGWCVGGDIWGGLGGRERMERQVLVFLPAEPMVPIGLSPRVLGWA